MSDIMIREATILDLPTLLEFEQGVIEAERPMDAGLKRTPTNYYDILHLVTSPDIRLAVAEIDGRVAGQDQRDEAERIARSTAGVKSVANLIEIGGSVSPPPVGAPPVPDREGDLP